MWSLGGLGVLGFWGFGGFRVWALWGLAVLGLGAFCGLRGPVDACYVGFRGFQGWVVFRALRLWWVRVLKIPGVLGSWGFKTCIGRVLGPGPGQGPGAGAEAARDPNPGPIPGLSSSLVPGNSRAYMPPTPPHTPRFTPFGPLQPPAHQRPVPLNGGASRQLGFATLQPPAHPSGAYVYGCLIVRRSGRLAFSVLGGMRTRRRLP